MKKTQQRILLVYPPFCTPALPPYSITYLYSFLKNNSDEHIDVLDLNLEFHKLKFSGYQRYIHRFKKDMADYDTATKKYMKDSAKAYSENNKDVLKGHDPEFFGELVEKIRDKRPDIVAFSIVYSSQAFYTYSLLKRLEIPCIIGGPAVNSRLKDEADVYLGNELELLSYISGKEADHDSLVLDFLHDFSIYGLDDYFTQKPVIPIKTTNTCFYRGCAFCSHFSDMPYHEYDLDNIRQTIMSSRQKYFYLIDDMMPKKRLIEVAEMLRQLDVHWTCQLRPTKDMDYKTLKKLKDSGLSMVLWGVESGDDHVLKLMNKGTNREDIEKVLDASHKAGIRNVVYMMFGFPGETKEEFLKSIGFLRQNAQNIDLISTSVFGLQKGTAVYDDPERYGISIHEKERTILEPKVSYDIKKGISQEEASILLKNYKKTIAKINKYPKSMNFFREHMFCMLQ